MDRGKWKTLRNPLQKNPSVARPQSEG